MEKHQIDKKMGPQKLHKTSEVEFSSRKNLANVHFQEDTLSVLVNFCSIFLDKKRPNPQKLTLWRRENTHEKRAQKQKESTNFSKNETYVNCKGHNISEAD